MARRPALAAVLAALLTACAGGPGAGRAGTAAGPAFIAAGRQVFTTACGGCHTLSGSDSVRRSGGDLLRVSLTRVQLTDYTREMPVRRPLTNGQLQAVVSYILHVQASGSLSGGAGG